MLPAIHTIPMKIQQTPWTHLQPTVMVINPPTIGPRTGPIKGAVAKMDIARPRWAGKKRSAISPPELVREDAPKVPARNLNTKSDAMELQPAEAPTKATISACVVMKMIRRPYSSDKGAHKAGPTANPSTK